MALRYFPLVLEETEREMIEREDDDELSYNDIINVYNERTVENFSVGDENVAPNSQTTNMNTQRNVDNISSVDESRTNILTSVSRRRKTKDNQRNRK